MSNQTHELLGCFANVWIRQRYFPVVGETIGGHKHKYDHVSLLSSGKAKVEVDGVEKEFTAPTFIIIRKDKIHNVTALEEGTTWYCIFANRDINGNVYDAENDPIEQDPQCHGTQNFDASSITINEL